MTAPRRSTAEEIARLGADQGKARRKGLIALVAGATTAIVGAAAVYLITQDRRVPLPPGPPAKPPVLRQAPVPVTPAPAPKTSRPGPRPKDPVLALAAPTELPRPAGPSAGPAIRAEKVDLEALARSLAEQKKGAVQLCFERELKRDPRLRGTVTVALELKAPHRLGQIDVQSSLPKQSFIKCVGQAMQNVDFPNLGEDVRVELPFSLQTPGL